MFGHKYFCNPQNGFVVRGYGAFWVLWAYLFGPFYYAAKGLWGHAIIFFLLIAPTLGLIWLLYPLFADGLIRRKYLEAGWTIVDRPTYVQDRNARLA